MLNLRWQITTNFQKKRMNIIKTILIKTLIEQTFNIPNTIFKINIEIYIKNIFETSNKTIKNSTTMTNFLSKSKPHTTAKIKKINKRENPC